VDAALVAQRVLLAQWRATGAVRPRKVAVPVADSRISVLFRMKMRQLHPTRRSLLSAAAIQARRRAMRSL
jgi:hypothetical protein